MADKPSGIDAPIVPAGGFAAAGILFGKEYAFYEIHALI